MQGSLRDLLFLWQTAGGAGTVPADICVTVHKPDLVIVDEKNNTLHIVELTVTFDLNLETRHREKSNKYAHFVTDVTNMNTSVICFKIGSLGFISTRNHSSLFTLHKFMKPGVKLKQFKQNISALSVNSSYHILFCNKESEWISTNNLPPPLSNRTTISYSYLFNVLVQCTGWPRKYRIYILQITQPSQYRYAKFQYRFAVIWVTQ